MKTFADSSGWCTAMIPEFQDVQRFVQRNTGHYGPLVQAVASPTLGALQHTAAFDGGYVLVAVAFVDSAPQPMGRPYANLTLTRGINCVFLMHDGSGWKARIVAAVAFKCPTASDAAAGPTIAVAAEDSVNASDIPPVVRFVQSSDTLTFLGVRCGTRWCNVGAGNLLMVPKPVHALTPGAPSTVQASIKGWFDEQQVGVPVSGALPITPSAFATVIPEPGLASISASSFATKFTPVARVYLSDDMAKYQKRFGFRKGWNMISLAGLNTSSEWLAEIRDANGGLHTRYVHRYAHTVGSIPGTARWAWTWRDMDEWIWVACEVGCCLIQPADEI